jgi:BirA family biotin operon repressor/biotin-[acetyl-CoA-carboxylase] ligase
LKSNLSESAPRDVALELERVGARRGAIGGRLYWLESAGSTNDVAAELAQDGAGEGTVVVAETQTAGRGRHGRVWFSPPGAGLYVSIVLRPSTGRGGDGRAAALLTIASGVAVAEAVRVATGLPAEIKWPNDVLIGRRLGVNLRDAAYPVELASRATSIEAETSRPPDRALIFAEILAAIGERYADLRAERFDAILGAWRRLAPSLASALVEWDSPGGVVRGRAEGIDDAGRLLVRVDGRLERLIAGEVRWI